MLKKNTFQNLFILFSFTAFGQMSLEIENINCIAYKNSRIDFISYKNNIPHKVYIEDDGNDTLIKLVPVYRFDKYSQVDEKEIAKNKLIKIEDIQSINVDYFIKNKKIEIVNKNGKKVISLFNNQIVMIEDYDYEDFFDKTKNKDVKGWHLTDTKFDYFYMINLGIGKNIMMIGDEDGFIIPIRKKIIIQYDDTDFTNGKVVKYNESHLLENMEDFDESDFYRIHKTSGKKQTLNNIFGDLLLEKKYDSIYIDQNYVVAKIDTVCEIYNTRLDKFDLKNIRVAYPRKYLSNLLQVLINKEVIKVNFLNQMIQKEILYNTVCGTVPIFEYSIKNDTLYAEKRDWMRLKKETNIVEINLNDRFVERFDSIRFLNNSQKYHFDGNDFYKEETISLPREWIIVSRNGKYGVYEFNIDREINYCLKEIIPIEYDSIESLGKDHPLKLCKNKLFSYYGINNKRYSELGKFQVYFCRFKDEFGKTGWLDHKGNECFD